MAIGIVEDSDFNKELEKINKPIAPTGQVVDKGAPGRKDGDVNVPDSLRKIIGETAVIDGRQEALALADMFGVSDSSVSAYSKGATSTASYNSPAKAILSHINKARQRSVKKASKVLSTALDSITPDKLNDLSARNLAGIAKDMSAVIKNLEPPDNGNDTPGAERPQFVIFAPQFRDERNFETIVVNE
jgi:predicted transcriptional regulator